MPRVLLNILIAFLKERKQVVLNDQHSKWLNISTGVSEGSILRPLPFLVYIDNLSSNPKLFAYETSHFFRCTSNQSVCNELKWWLGKLRSWAFQWKMSLNLTSARRHFFSETLEVKLSIFNIQRYMRYPTWNSKTLRNISGFKTWF